MTNGTTENLLAIYHLSSASDKAYGLGWYQLAFDIAENIGKIGNIGTMRAAAVIAALSPNNRWERNTQDAENLVRAYVAGGADAAEEIKVCTYGANKRKAIKLLSQDTVLTSAYLEILNGRKIKAFFSCIINAHNDDSHEDDSLRVCVDGHAYGIWIGERLSMKKVPNIGVKLYKAIAADYIAAANEIGIRPSELQAITWCTWRRIHDV